MNFDREVPIGSRRDRRDTPKRGRGLLHLGAPNQMSSWDIEGRVPRCALAPCQGERRPRRASRSEARAG